MESRLLDRKVKKMMAKIGKSSNSDQDKGPIPMPIDPLLNSDSTNKAHMGDSIPIHLVHGGRIPTVAPSAPLAGPGSGPPSGPSSGPGPTAPAPGAAPPAAAPPPPQPLSQPDSEQPLSPRTPVKDPVTGDEISDWSGHTTAPPTDYVSVSPTQDARPKLPDMSDLPSVSTIDQSLTDLTSRTDGTSSQPTMPTATTTNPAPKEQSKKKDDTDTLKMLDDPIYGLKTEILSPDPTITQSEFTNDPFQTYAVPTSMLREEKARQQQQGRSNLQRAPSDVTTLTPHPVTNPHLSKTTVPPPSADDVPVYTPPSDHSPVPVPVPAPIPVAKPAPVEVAPSLRQRSSYHRYPDPVDEPIFTPPRSQRNQRQSGLFDSHSITQQSSRTYRGRDVRNEQQYPKPSGYFTQRAKSWLAKNRDSDSERE